MRGMEIDVKVATILLKKADPPLTSTRFSLPVEDGTNVEGLIETLGVPPRLVGSVTVNNRRSPRDRMLANGDLVAIIPAISGG